MKMTLEEINKQIEELKKQKEEILTEEKKRLESEKEERMKEINDAYGHYIALKRKFDEDYNISYYPSVSSIDFGELFKDIFSEDE